MLNLMSSMCREPAQSSRHTPCAAFGTRSVPATMETLLLSRFGIGGYTGRVSGGPSVSPHPAMPSRRDLLRVGALGAAGLTLPDLLRHRAIAGEVGSADACILVFCWGAPSQYETFDPKPEAPDGIRGEFGTIRTRLPGVLFGEHIPLLAQRNEQYTIIRTCAQTSTHHQSATYEALTGYPPSRDAV